MKGALAGLILVLIALWAVLVLDVLGVIALVPEAVDGPILAVISLLLAVVGLMAGRRGGGR
jgi:hypothetical protein